MNQQKEGQKGGYANWLPLFHHPWKHTLII